MRIIETAGRICKCEMRRIPMAASGHVWTAPWQGLSDVSAASVERGHGPLPIR